MARTTAQLDGAALVLPADDASLIPLDTPAWFAWLERQIRGGEYCRA